MKRILVIIFLAMTSCGKLLDVIPDKQLATTDELKALQGILDENFAINRSGNGLGEASADDFYLDQEGFNAMAEPDRNTYIWEMDNAAETPYMVMYRKINLANIVLDAIDAASGGEEEKKRIRGGAKFIRANAYFSLAVTFVKAYDPLTSKTDQGLVLRHNSDFNERSFRSTAENTYLQIEKDALEAIDLLPEMASHPYRPSKLSCYALLSRFYLSKRDYEKAEHYADKFLAVKRELLDYNAIDVSARYPFEALNQEVIYNDQNSSVTFFLSAAAKVDTTLYQSYEDSDLRKEAFFFSNPDGSVRFKGSYTASAQPFIGYAIDELLLTKAECLARRGQVRETEMLMGELLRMRYKTGMFEGAKLDSKEKALDFVLLERRKELLMRDVRWMDIKRLNQEPRYQKKLIRKIGNDVYELNPGENRYALPLPNSVIEITGIPQNER